jgi:predicted metal-dependent phosphoesterase TrpH
MNKKHGLAKIEEIINLSGADLHIHSNFSDGRPTIQEILDYVENETDLNCIAITDHDTIEGALLAAELVKKGNYRFDFIIGEEVSSKEGHILGLFLKKTIPAGLGAHQVIAEIHNQGGIAIAAHPFQHSRLNNPKIIIMDGVGAATLINERHYFDGIEIVNATPTLEKENVRAAALNKTLLGLTETGSSDAHIKEAIGRGYTLFEGSGAADFKKAFLHRQTQAMHARWTVMALVKYLFFFIPKGFRLLINTLIHGRLPKRTDLF